jgi:hypothetical protein
LISLPLKTSSVIRENRQHGLVSGHGYAVRETIVLDDHDKKKLMKHARFVSEHIIVHVSEVEPPADQAKDCPVQGSKLNPGSQKNL